MALGAARPFSLAPDGTALAYVGHEEEGTALYVRTLDRLRTVRVKGSEGALAPFFSPDGRWIGFFARGVLWKVFGSEGSPIPLCETEADPRGGTWGRSDVIVFAASPAAPLSRIDANGGRPIALTTLEFAAGERTHRWPAMLPSGREVLFTVASAGSASFDQADIWSVSLETGTRRLVQSFGSSPQFVRTGHLVYMRGGSIMAVPFDADEAIVRGAPIPVVSGVMTLPTGAGQMAVADSGLLAYLEGEFHDVDRRLTWVTADGVQDSPLPSLPFEEPRLSPAASHVAVGVRRATNDIWIGDCAAGTLRRLTFDGDNFAPIWTPDGRAVTFSSNRNGPCNLYQVAIEGGAPMPLVTSDFDLVPGSWTPDGETLLFTLYHPDSGADIFRIRPRDGAPPEPLVRTPCNECAPAVAPNGRAFAFASDESGQFEVYVMLLDGPGPPRQISRDGGMEPVWSRDGRRLAFRNGSGVLAVDVDATSATATGPPQIIADGPYEAGSPSGLPNFDLSPDGRILAVSRVAAPAQPRELAVVVNWFSELCGRQA